MAKIELNPEEIRGHLNNVNSALKNLSNAVNKIQKSSNSKYTVEYPKRYRDLMMNVKDQLTSYSRQSQEDIEYFKKETEIVEEVDTQLSKGNKISFKK